MAIRCPCSPLVIIFVVTVSLLASGIIVAIIDIERYGAGLYLVSISISNLFPDTVITPRIPLEIPGSANCRGDDKHCDAGTVHEGSRGGLLENVLWRVKIYSELCVFRL